VFRILVVDDEPDVAEFVELVLRADGHEVETVHSGRAALARLAHESYDLIVCDLHMPDVDGREIYQVIQHRPAPRPPVLFVSGYHDSDEYESFLRAGRLPALAKPFTVDALRESVRRLLGERGHAG
jgi:CheY-like chemotaxis protein